MKGLLFTLLNQMAESAGCSDEAWELVMEFAAAETLVCDEDQDDAGSMPSDAARIDLFDVPAEAMLNCLCRERRGLTQDEWENLEPETRLKLSGNDDAVVRLPRVAAHQRSLPLDPAIPCGD